MGVDVARRKTRLTIAPNMGLAWAAAEPGLARPRLRARGI